MKRPNQVKERLTSTASPYPKELYYALRIDVGQEKRGTLFGPVPETEGAGRKGKDKYAGKNIKCGGFCAGL